MHGVELSCFFRLLALFMYKITVAEQTSKHEASTGSLWESCAVYIPCTMDPHVYKFAMKASMGALKSSPVTEE